jgi:asparagine synthetase B (glutamine-hydrolysing)
MDFTDPREELLSIPTPLLCVPKRSVRLVNAMDNDNARVLLNGLGGDHIFWNMPDASPELAPLLSEGKLLALNHKLKQWSRTLNLTYVSVFMKMTLLPFLPSGIRARYQRLKTPDWISPQFARQFNLRDRILPPTDPYGFSNIGQSIQASVLQQLIRLIASGSYQESQRIEVRSPFLYRPLVELLLLIPFDQKLRPQQTRSLMRRALKEVLPAKILDRPGKGEISEAMKRGWYRQRSRLQQLLTDARIVALGYVDRGELDQAVKLAIHGGKVDIGALNKTLSLEIWLRSIEHFGAVLAPWNQRSREPEIRINFPLPKRLLKQSPHLTSPHQNSSQSTRTL